MEILFAIKYVEPFLFLTPHLIRYGEYIKVYCVYKRKLYVLADNSRYENLGSIFNGFYIIGIN